MAKMKAKSATAKRQAKATARSGGSMDAIELLKADHQQVAAWFEEFGNSDDESEKAELAERICSALKVHAAIEEEIFYPAFLEATQNMDLHHEAEVEHKGAKRLIADIEESGPDDEYFDAHVTVLGEMIKHHVKEEEQPGGMFAEARKAGVDLDSLGKELARRKKELEAEEDAVTADE